jgi:hypothetical protein
MPAPEILSSPKIPQTETKVSLRVSAPKARDQKSAEKTKLTQSKSLSAVKLPLNNDALSSVKLKRSPTATRVLKTTTSSLVQSTQKQKSRLSEANPEKENERPTSDRNMK